MKIVAPSHVANYCILGNENDSIFQNLSQKYSGKFSYLYKLKCSCDNERFFIFSDNHPTIIAECSDCKKRITIYDLANYPTATKLSKEYEVSKVSDSPSELYVNYEYSDECLYDKDVELDLNDITWAKVFIIKNGKPLMILDDETS